MFPLGCVLITVCFMLTWAQEGSIKIGMAEVRLEIEKEKILKYLKLPQRPPQTLNYPKEADLKNPIVEDFDQRIIPQSDPNKFYIGANDIGNKPSVSYELASKYLCPSDCGDSFELMQNSICFCFDIAQSSLQDTLQMGLLWLYINKAKPRNKVDETTVDIQMFQPFNHTSFGETHHYVAPGAYEWFNLNITDIIAAWKSDFSQIVEQRCLRVACENCGETPSFNPLIAEPHNQPLVEIITTPRESLSRKRRNDYCSSPNPTACCVQRWFVNFTEVGWNDWIFQPRGYEANFCKGSCQDVISNTYRKLVGDAYRQGVNTDKDLLGCCKPKKMLPLKILYMTEENIQRYTTIPNMQVVSCDC